MYFTPTSGFTAGSIWSSAFSAISLNNDSAMESSATIESKKLIMAIGEYIDKHNDSPKPFVWTAKAADILEKVKRARAVLDNS